MAKTNLSQLKNWFKNGLKPAQEHFWNWMDSFWHKDEFIPMDSIESLNETLGNKADVDHGHSDLAKKNASNLEPTDIDNWRELLFDNETGELTDQHIQLTDGYPDLAIPPESTQKDFNDVISSEVAALKEVDETPYMTAAILRLNQSYDGFSVDETFAGFVAPFDLKIKDMKIMLNSVVGSLGSVNVAVSVNANFIGVNEMFFVVAAGKKVSENTPDIIGMTFNRGDFFEYHIHSATNNTADTIMAFVEYERVESESEKT